MSNVARTATYRMSETFSYLIVLNEGNDGTPHATGCSGEYAFFLQFEVRDG